jgi:hypothetical protein
MGGRGGERRSLAAPPFTSLPAPIFVLILVPIFVGTIVVPIFVSILVESPWQDEVAWNNHAYGQ